MTMIDKAEALAALETVWRTMIGGAEVQRKVNAAIAALPARGVGVQWQKIDTAPRGGEWFIARTEHGTTRVVRFADEYDRFPISHDGAVWPTAPTEWTSLKPILSALTTTTFDDREAPNPVINELECTDCGGTGITYQTERRCACQPTDAAQAREAALKEAEQACDYVFDTATESGVAVGAHECRTKIKALMEAKS